MNDQASTEAKPKRGVAGLFLLLIVVELVLLAVWWYASYYWTLPVWAIVAYVALGIAAVGLFVLVVSKSKRKLLGLLITVVLVAVVAVAFMLASIGFPAEWLPAKDRVAQIGEEAGITVLLPEGVELPAKNSYEPSSDLIDGVVTIQYQDFHLSESASDSVKTPAELKKYIDLLQPEPGSQVTLQVSSPQTIDVLGQPAIAVTWREVVGGKGPQGSSTILIFQPEGMVVRLTSSPESGLTPDALAAMAESLKPVK